MKKTQKPTFIHKESLIVPILLKKVFILHNYFLEPLINQIHQLYINFLPSTDTMIDTFAPFALFNPLFIVRLRIFRSFAT